MWAACKNGKGSEVPKIPVASLRLPKDQGELGKASAVPSSCMGRAGGRAQAEAGMGTCVCRAGEKGQNPVQGSSSAAEIGCEGSVGAL